MKFLGGVLLVVFASVVLAAPLASAQQFTAFGSSGFEVSQNSCEYNKFRHGNWYGPDEVWAVVNSGLYAGNCGKQLRICSADASSTPNHCQATTLSVLIIDLLPGRIPADVGRVQDTSFPGDIWLSLAAWNFIVGGGSVNTAHQVQVL